MALCECCQIADDCITILCISVYLDKNKYFSSISLQFDHFTLKGGTVNSPMGPSHGISDTDSAADAVTHHTHLMTSLLYNTYRH